MANELLDFVMSLVRDPDAAARYAADPSSAIANAHLANVTSVDVNNLIPMVTDSLSMAAPAVGGGNVWTSGAAAAAFDSFIPHVPPVHDFSGNVIDTPAMPAADAPAVEVAQFSDVIDEHSPAGYDAMNEFATDGPSAWDEGATDLHHDVSDGGHDHSGFDFLS